jgi:hypothetical protein
MDIESLEKPLWKGRRNAQCQCLSISKKHEYFFRTPSCVRLMGVMTLRLVVPIMRCSELL